MHTRTVYLSLGADCSVARYLRKIGLRKDAYPFDWLLTPAPSAIQLLANDFEGFLEMESLRFLPPRKRRLFAEHDTVPKDAQDLVTPVFCRRYGIWSVHDFSERGAADYPAVKAKYERRIARLRQLLREDVRKMFVLDIPDGARREGYRREGLTFEADYTAGEILASFDALGLANAELVLLADLRRGLGVRAKILILANRLRSRLRAPA